MKRICLIVLAAGCTTSEDLDTPAYVADGISATVVQSGDEAVVTLEATNPSDWDGQEAMVQRALEAAEVLTGCYSAPKPSPELDAYVAGAEPIRIAVDLEC